MEAGIVVGQVVELPRRPALGQGRGQVRRRRARVLRVELRLALEVLDQLDAPLDRADVYGFAAEVD